MGPHAKTCQLRSETGLPWNGFSSLLVVFSKPYHFISVVRCLERRLVHPSGSRTSDLTGEAAGLATWTELRALGVAVASCLVYSWCPGPRCAPPPTCMVCYSSRSLSSRDGQNWKSPLQINLFKLGLKYPTEQWWGWDG